MQVRVAENQAEWNEFVAGAQSPSSFLQSWEWGAMQAAYGHPLYRWVVEKDGAVVAALACVALDLALGRRVLQCSRGPIVAEGVSINEVIQAVLASDQLVAAAQAEHAIALRIEPLEQMPAGARRVHDTQPAETLLLDLRKSTDELLAEMKQKTRYNIRLAQKKGVEVSWHSTEAGNNADAAAPDWDALAEQWWTLLEETSSRHGIAHHSKEYYHAMITELGQAGMVHVGVASHEGDTLAVALFTHFGDTFTYVHGASTQKKRKLMASYGLQWSAIERAKEVGAAHYDFFGIAPKGEEKHRLAGVTRFKNGFGGTHHTYPGTADMPIARPWYTVYRVAATLKSVF